MARKNRKDRGVFPYCLSDGKTERFGVRLYHCGIAHKWSGFSTKTEARQWYEDRRRDIREGKPFPDRRGTGPTMGSTIDRYLVQATNKKNFSGEQAYAAFWKSYLGNRPRAGLTPDLIDHARSHLLTKGATGKRLTHATVNRYVAWLRHVCQIEVNKGTMERNPCRGLKFKEPKAPEVEFTEAEELAIAKELGPYADVPTLAIMTGLRQDELFGLRSDDVFLSQGYGKLHDPKGGEPQVFLINQQAARIFRSLIGRTGSPWLFPNPRDGSKHLHPKSFYNHTFKAACRRAGIELSRKNGKTFHTLRHTFASRLQQAGVEVKDIKDLGRWKSWKAMERYLKRDQSRLRLSIERLGVPHGTAQKQPIIGLSKVDNFTQPVDSTG